VVPGDDGEGDGVPQTASVVDAIPGTVDDPKAAEAMKLDVLLPPRLRPGAALKRHFILVAYEPYRALRLWYGDRAMLRREVYDRAAPTDGSAPGPDHFPDNVVDLYPERRVKQQVEEQEM